METWLLTISHDYKDLDPEISQWYANTLTMTMTFSYNMGAKYSSFSYFVACASGTLQ